MKKKCVPEGQDGKGQGRRLGRGGGEGPMGKPFKTLQDEMFAMDVPEVEKIENMVDLLVDSAVAECGDENATLNEPSDEPSEELDRVHYDIAEYGDPKDTEEEYPPGPQDDDGLQQTDDDFYSHGGRGIGEQLEIALNEEEYKAFFKSMMDKFGITSFKGLSVEKKREFFGQVGAAWRSKKEGGEGGLQK